MNHKEFTKKLFKLSIGQRMSVKRDAGEEEYTRMPSGWLYRFATRTSVAVCFVPYSEDINIWDMDLDIPPCPSCTSTEVFLAHATGEGKNDWEVKCSSCTASSGVKHSKAQALTTWRRMCKK